MRIGIDTHFISSGQATGNRTYTTELVKALINIDNQNDFLLYAIDNHVFYSQFVDKSNVHIHFNLSPNGVIRNFSSIPKAVILDTPDLIHLQFISPLYLRTPTVLTVHDLYYAHLITPTLYEKCLNLLTIISIRRANIIITPSEFSKRDIVSRCSLNPDRISVIPLGVDCRFKQVEDSDLIQKTKLKFGIRHDYILYVGRTEDPRKNLHTLIKAYSHLCSEADIREHLVIAGRHGRGTIDLKRLVGQLGLTERVIFPGIIKESELTPILSGAKVFVYTSSFEGFGLPVLEAMACGTPVITSNTTSLPEIAGDAAIMVTPGNVDELEQALLLVLNNSDQKQQMHNRGLEQAAQFTWERAARETLAVYKKIVKP